MNVYLVPDAVPPVSPVVQPTPISTPVSSRVDARRRTPIGKVSWLLTIFSCLLAQLSHVRPRNAFLTLTGRCAVRAFLYTILQVINPTNQATTPRFSLFLLVGSTPAWASST